MVRTAKQLREDNSRQAKLAALKAAEQRRRTNRMVSIGGIGVVLLIVIVMVIIKVATSGPKKADVSSSASNEVTQAVTSVPSSTFDAVGVGQAKAVPTALKTPIATPAGKLPKVLYVGAEYCPYCAAERWAFTAALARFGTFSNLGQTSSSSSDVYPDTATLSFHGATYTSKYLSLAAYETEDRNEQPLDTVPSADEALVKKYDAKPYVDVPADQGNPIPFIMLGGRYIISGASYDPGVLKGLSQAQIALAMADPTSTVAKSIDGTANLITAALCSATGSKPADVCTSAGVTAATKQLQAG